MSNSRNIGPLDYATPPAPKENKAFQALGISLLVMWVVIIVILVVVFWLNWKNMEFWDM